MNERIQELAEQAGIYQPDRFTTVDGSNQLEKFAELIIQDCVGVVTGGHFLHNQAPDAIFAKNCGAAIKRHFEVKDE